MTEDLVLDFAHLEAQARATGARLLMLSHMRGHLCDMEALMALCARLGLKVIEDCPHTMGADWRGVPSGRHGLIGCYSTQTYKHMNSGEGGLLITDDAEMAARMNLLGGSYMLYGRDRAARGEEVFRRLCAAPYPASYWEDRIADEYPKATPGKPSRNVHFFNLIAQTMVIVQK